MSGPHPHLRTTTTTTTPLHFITHQHDPPNLYPVPPPLFSGPEMFDYLIGRIVPLAVECRTAMYGVTDMWSGRDSNVSRMACGLAWDGVKLIRL